MAIGGLSLVALPVLAAVTQAPAPEPVPVRIEFDAPSDCPTAQDFYDGIRLRTDRVRQAAPGESGLGIIVKLARDGNTVDGELRVIGDQGETDTRRVEGTSCEEVVQALSLTATLAVDPTARLSPLPEPEPPKPPAPPQPQCAPCPPPPRPPTSAPPPSALPGASCVEVEVGLGATVVDVVSPHTALGPSAFGRLAWPERPGAPWGSVGLSFQHVRSDFAGTSDRAAVRFTAAALSVCPTRWRVEDWLRVEPCAVGMLGILDATGRSVTYPESVERSWWSAGVLARAAGSLGAGFSVELELALSLPLIKRRFITTSPDQGAGETPTLSPLGTLGLVRAF